MKLFKQMQNLFDFRAVGADDGNVIDYFQLRSWRYFVKCVVVQELIIVSADPQVKLIAKIDRSSVPANIESMIRSPAELKILLH